MISRLRVAAGAAAVGLVLTMAASGRVVQARQGLAGNVPTALLAQSKEVGPAAPSAHIALIIGLAFRQPPGMPRLSQFILDTVTPGSAYYHQYLTPAQFRRLYDQPASVVAKLETYFESFGMQASQTETSGGVSYTSNNYLFVDGTVAEAEQALGVPINEYTFNGRSFLANPVAPSLGDNLDQYVSGIAGLLTLSNFHPATVNVSQVDPHVQLQTCSYQGFGDCTAPTGLSPQDVQTIYNVRPLYQQGITGSGETIAIATLAPILTSDPPGFWQYYGIHRTGTLMEIGVGEAIPPGGMSGRGIGGSETDLDVEQSGAMAPGANIEVYVAPNTNDGFVNLFNAVVNGYDGVVPDVMSVSWGEAEQFETAGYATLLNQQFEQGAAEGISMFVASGDSGAFDAYGALGYDHTLAVDSPADLTWATAAGGTTLGADETAGVPGIPSPSQLSCMPAAEQAWGWDYLVPCWSFFGYHNSTTWQRALYPVGSGGGYSLYFPEPSWQSAFGGANLTGAGGKGVPDVAFNADPFTGYSIYDTSSVYTTASAPWTDGWGGTSFAAPNWNGITALLDQYEGARLGFLPPTLYTPSVADNGFRPITAGDNWYYHASAGWNAATGLGVPNVAQLAKAVQAVAP
jgi:kumamolisin